LSRNQHTSDFADATALLVAADQKQVRDGGRRDLVSYLLDEVMSSISAGYVNLWEIVPSGRPNLLEARGRAQHDSKNALLASVGIVKRLGVSEGESHCVCVSAVSVCKDVGLVLEAELPNQTFYADFWEELSEVLGDLHRRRLLSNLWQSARYERTLHQILETLHSDLDSVRVANCLASDTVELLGCSRITVAKWTESRRWEAIAATSVSQLEMRADASRWICETIKSCQESGKENCESMLEKATRSGILTGQECIVRPLTYSGEWENAKWAAMFEWTAPNVSAERTHVLQTLCRHTAQALKNCEVNTQSSILSRFRSAPAGFLSRRYLLPGVCLMIACIAMVFAKLPLRIEVMGKLVPTQRMFVFAPEEGVVTEVFVEDGTNVSDQAVLCKLRNEDLEIQQEAIEGELSSVQARLAALDALRGDRSLNQSGLLSAEQAEMQKKLQSFEKQLEILNRRLAGLTIHAAIPGRVYGDRLRELLLGRPVHRGQYLFELANPDGAWQLDFRVPESEIRYVIQAVSDTSHSVNVSYIVETAPETIHKSSLTHVGESTDVDEYGRLSTQVTIDSSLDEIQMPRPGAGAIGWIDCGRYSAGYVLFRRIIESLERKWWM